MTAVWESSKQKGTALLLLLAIADYANDGGAAWPAVGTLAKKIRMSERYTQMLIADLVKAGEISISDQTSRYGTNTYTILQGVRPASPMKQSSPVKRGSRKGEAGLVPPVNPASPEPSLNHQEPPLGADAPSAPDPVKELGAVFTEASGIQEITGRSVGPIWWNPLREMVKLANGTAPVLLRQTVEKLRKSGMTITDPNSCIKTFRGLHGTTIVAPPTERFIDYE